jgi:hypothetical protein
MARRERADTEQDVTFHEIVLLPSTMESVKVLTRYSNELARQSVVSLDAAMKDRLVRDVAAKTERSSSPPIFDLALARSNDSKALDPDLT